MTEDMHEERLQAVEALGDSFVSTKLYYRQFSFLIDNHQFWWYYYPYSRSLLLVVEMIGAYFGKSEVVVIIEWLGA